MTKKWLKLLVIIIGGTALVGMLFVFTTIRNINNSMAEERRSYARLCADYLAQNPSKGEELEKLIGNNSFSYHIYAKTEIDEALSERVKEGSVFEKNELCLYQTSLSEEMPGCIIEVRCDISDIYKNSRQMYRNIAVILISGACFILILSGIWMLAKRDKRR